MSGLGVCYILLSLIGLLTWKNASDDVFPLLALFDFSPVAVREQIKVSAYKHSKSPGILAFVQ